MLHNIRSLFILIGDNISFDDVGAMQRTIEQMIYASMAAIAYFHVCQ